MRYPRHYLAHYQYFLQYHQLYALQYATHASTSTTLLTLVRQPRHPRCHVNHASMSITYPKLACHPRQHASQASAALTQRALKQQIEASLYTLYWGLKEIPVTLYTYVLAKILQNGAKFILKLTPGFKNDMRNLNNFRQAVESPKTRI